ncbi:hypothetical protein BCR36DRAFT_404306 [Piromyces finnis]|uniref:Uncharacterized protein n=1 Tax=Piromyces finnis TaxID=1754191 RepID=A0A1Y1VA07_9FUNG|nr:hypothetical protein BCR36DRAFT_404306 [Piromyces finnis]|eukprot:ORX50684.1 hypothetical protein BCR36DRAFT_404306 [Piromyces finnis]
MPKSTQKENSSGITTTDSHSKKWFSKIALKIPKKLKNGKNTSSLTSALNHAKRNNSFEGLTKLSQQQCDNSMSNQTIYETSEEINSTSTKTLIAKTSQLTIHSVKKNNSLNSDISSNPLSPPTPLIRISSIPIESKNELKDTNTQTKTVDTNNNTYLNNLTSTTGHCHCHRRSSSDYINTPVQRPRSYSDTPVPVPVHPSTTLYYDDDNGLTTDTAKSYEIPKNLRQLQLDMVKENYLYDKDLEILNKTPVTTTRHTPIDTSNFTTPSNTITEKMTSNQSTSVVNTPVLKHHENATPSTPDRRLNSIIEAMQNKTCDNMTAKEFALAVGINICSDDSDSEDEDDNEDKNSICTLSSTLSQLTANGKIPTPNEIYNALSIKSLGRQKRKHSAPILNLDMFNPPAPGECAKSASSCQSFKNEINKCCQRPIRDLSRKTSNPKIERKLPSCISTLKSTESNLTCVANKNTSESSIYSSYSGNTTSFVSDLADCDFDSYCSSTSYLQQSMNGSPDINKNNISTTFYSLPRVAFHSTVNNSPIAASKSTNSIQTSNFYTTNYNHYRDMGVNNNSRCHSRISSSISISSQSSSIKKGPSSPISVTPSPVLFPMAKSSINVANTNINVNKSNVNDTQNMYINSNTIAASISKPIHSSFPNKSNVYPTSSSSSSSWSNEMNDTEKLCLTQKTTVAPKMIKTENKVEVYTKGRFTITHETYNHSRSASSHKFQVEKN